MNQIIVDFKEDDIAVLDVIAVIRTPGLGKTTHINNDKSVTSHFDICPSCTIDEECKRKNML